MKLTQILTTAVSILTLASMTWLAYSKPATWDQTSRDVAELKPKVENQGHRLTTTEAHYQDIIRRLDKISAKLDE